MGARLAVLRAPVAIAEVTMSDAAPPVKAASVGGWRRLAPLNLVGGGRESFGLVSYNHHLFYVRLQRDMIWATVEWAILPASASG